MDDKSETHLLKELRGWCSRNSNGLSVHEKAKYGPKISDAAGIFIAASKLEINLCSIILQNPPHQWADRDFKKMEAKIETLRDEIEFLRTVNG